jgi:hypothetical protein
MLLLPLASAHDHLRRPCQSGHRSPRASHPRTAQSSAPVSQLPSAATMPMAQAHLARKRLQVRARALELRVKPGEVRRELREADHAVARVRERSEAFCEAVDRARAEARPCKPYAQVELAHARLAAVPRDAVKEAGRALDGRHVAHAGARQAEAALHRRLREALDLNPIDTRAAQRLHVARVRREVVQQLAHVARRVRAQRRGRRGDAARGARCGAAAGARVALRLGPARERWCPCARHHRCAYVNLEWSTRTVQPDNNSVSVCKTGLPADSEQAHRGAAVNDVSARVRAGLAERVRAAARQQRQPISRSSSSMRRAMRPPSPNDDSARFGRITSS